MINEIIVGAVAIIVALVGGYFGVVEIKKHGAEKQRRKDAEEERDEVIKRENDSNSPDLDGSQRDDFIDKL